LGTANCMAQHAVQGAGSRHSHSLGRDGQGQPYAACTPATACFCTHRCSPTTTPRAGLCTLNENTACWGQPLGLCSGLSHTGSPEHPYSSSHPRPQLCDQPTKRFSAVQGGACAVALLACLAPYCLSLLASCGRALQRQAQCDRSQTGCHFKLSSLGML